MALNVYIGRSRKYRITILIREGFNGVLLATLGWEHKLPEILNLTYKDNQYGKYE